MTGFAYSNLYTKDLPPPTPRWGGFPPYYFVGGNNDRRLLTVPGHHLRAIFEERNDVG